MSPRIFFVQMPIISPPLILKRKTRYLHGGAGTVPLRISNSPSTCWIHKGRNRTKPNFMPFPPSQPCVCTALHKMFTIWTGQPGWHVPSWQANSWKSVPTGKSPCEVSSMNLPGKSVFWHCSGTTVQIPGLSFQNEGRRVRNWKRLSDCP